ncbi:hypothetical protein LCGC14_2153900, partial [marine sediment metagenome]
GRNTFDDTIIRRVAQSDPEAVFNSTINLNRPTTIRRVRSIINNKETWRNIQGHWIRRIFGESEKEVGELSG